MALHADAGAQGRAQARALVQMQVGAAGAWFSGAAGAAGVAGAVGYTLSRQLAAMEAEVVDLYQCSNSHARHGATVHRAHHRCIRPRWGYLNCSREGRLARQRHTKLESKWGGCGQ